MVTKQLIIKNYFQVWMLHFGLVIVIGSCQNYQGDKTMVSIKNESEATPPPLEEVEEIEEMGFQVQKEKVEGIKVGQGFPAQRMIQEEKLTTIQTSSSRKRKTPEPLTDPSKEKKKKSQKKKKGRNSLDISNNNNVKASFNSGATSVINLLDMPVEILVNILSYLSFSELMKVRQVGTGFYELITGYPGYGLYLTDTKWQGWTNSHVWLNGKVVNFTKQENADLKPENFPKFFFDRFLHGTINLPFQFYPYLQNSQLQVLISSYNNVEANRLTEFLPSITKLQKLNLSNSSTRAIGINDELAGALASMNKLQEFLLSGTSLGNKGAWSLEKVLQGMINLYKLILIDNDIGDQELSVLMNVLPSMIKLQELVISNRDNKKYVNKIEAQGVAWLSKALKHMAELRKLDLSGNNIGNEGIKSLMEILAAYVPNLQELDLSSNNIGSEGIKELGKVLPRIVNLQQLDLSNNKLKNEGAEFIAEALPSMVNLRRFALVKSGIGARGVKAIVKGSSQLSDLEWLNLTGNTIGKKASDMLQQIKSTNTKLKVYW